MPIVTLTEITVRNIKPPPQGQALYIDKTLTGFGVRITENGAKSYVLTYGTGNRRRVTIGDATVIPLAKARDKARAILAEYFLAGKQDRPSMTFAEVREAYLKVGQWKPSTAYENRRLLERHFAPLDSRRLDTLRTADYMQLVDGLMDKASEANHAFTAIKSLTRWYSARGYAPNVLEALRKPVKPQSRERVLLDPELAVLLKCARRAHTYGVILELLLLTGQRLGQIYPFTGELLSDRLTWKSNAMKGNRAHFLPLTARVKELLDQLKPFNNFSTAHSRFLKESGMAHFTRHDLRRSFASGWQRLGIRMEVTESALAHRSGSFAGVTGVYQRYDYFSEVLVALTAWENHLQTLTTA